MKKSSRKLVVFLAINIQLMILFVLVVFFAPSALAIIGVPLLISMTGNGVSYITGNVVHAWQKSKYYIDTLDQKKQGGRL